MDKDKNTFTNFEERSANIHNASDIAICLPLSMFKVQEFNNHLRKLSKASRESSASNIHQRITLVLMEVTTLHKLLYI